VHTVVIDGHSLTREDVVRVAREGARVELAPAAVEAMRETRALAERLLDDDGTEVYGFTTGVGVRKRVRVSRDAMTAFQRRLLLDHLVAQGQPAPEDLVRATMVRLLNGLARGTGGVRPLLAERLVDALNHGERPRVRPLGGIGLADLGPLTDLAVALFADTELAAKEALPLINTNAFATAHAALAVTDAERLLGTLRTLAALDLEGFGANLTPLHPAVAEARGHPGLRTESAGLRALLDGSPLHAPGAARNLQDPLSFRGAAAVLGAGRDALAQAERVLAIELVAPQENPFPVPAEGRFISAANYESLPLAAALDYLRVGLAPCLSAANERCIKLLQAPQTGLTDGLAPWGHEDEGGLSEFAWTAQTIALEARLLIAPVSAEIPSSSQAEGIEDRAAMTPLAARRVAEQVELGERLAAIGLVVAAQAVELRLGSGAPTLGAPLRPVFDAVRTVVPNLAPGTTVAPDLEPLRALIRGGRFVPAA
jgi:histidine ammonia-lyase